jgi:CubicO group peptidase (beta-lactamase class C family)
LKLLPHCYAFSDFEGFWIAGTIMEPKPTMPFRNIDCMDQILQPILEKFRVPALCAAVASPIGMVAAGAVGLRKVTSPVAVTIRDKFHLGSNTKAMTATMIAACIERELFSWDTTLEAAFPDLLSTMHPQYREVTMKRLLMHQAGFGEGTYPISISFRDMFDRGTTSLVDQRVAYATSVLTEEPTQLDEAKHRYSNKGYVIAAAMAEKLTGCPWETLMERLIFTPMQMSSYGYGAMGTAANVDQPWQHQIVKGDLVAIEPGLHADNPPVLRPAGGVHCSMLDWAKFLSAHLEDNSAPGLLSANVVRALHETGPGDVYACGWIIAKRSWGGGRVLTHAGSNTLSFSVCWLAPAKRLAFLAATNQGGEVASKACDEAIAELIQKYLPIQ